MTQPRLWTREFIIVSALNFFLVLVFYLLVVVIGLYATNELGASASQAGLVVGMFILGALTGRLLIGQLLDVVGLKRTMLAGLALSIVCCLLYFVEAGIGFLIANRFLHGISVGIASTAVATVVAHLIPAHRKGEGISYFSLSTTLGTATGPFIGIFMTQHTEFRVLLAVCTLLSVTSLVVALTLKVAEQSDTRQRLRDVRFSLNKLVEIRVVPICLITVLGGIYYSGVLAYISAYAVELNLTQAASFFFVAYSAAVLVSRPFSGRLLDRRGPDLVMYPCFALLALGLWVLGNASSGSLILLAGALIGLGFGNIQSCTQALTIKLVEPARMGLATSTFFIFTDMGLGFGPYLLGLIIPYTGYGDLYQLLGILALSSAGVYYLLLGRHKLDYNATGRP